MRVRLTATDLREIVKTEIASSIDLHRASRFETDSDYIAPDGEPIEQEITDFIRTNQLLDFKTIDFSSSPSILGFETRFDSVRAEWLEEFKDNVHDWAETNTWQGADLLDIEVLIKPEPTKSTIWHPTSEIIQPSWIEKSPSTLILAADLLRSGRLLSELSWRNFEKLIATLLEQSGWCIELTRGSKDGGIDVIATMEDSEVGLIKALWQAKKHSLKNKVRIHEVRELSAIRDNQKATKGMLVTTSHLTRGALEWIQQDEYRLGFKDKSDVEKWVLDSI